MAGFGKLFEQGPTRGHTRASLIPEPKPVAFSGRMAVWHTGPDSPQVRTNPNRTRLVGRALDGQVSPRVNHRGQNRRDALQSATSTAVGCAARRSIVASPRDRPEGLRAQPSKMNLKRSPAYPAWTRPRRISPQQYAGRLRPRPGRLARRGKKGRRARLSRRALPPAGYSWSPSCLRPISAPRGLYTVQGGKTRTHPAVSRSQSSKEWERIYRVLLADTDDGQLVRSGAARRQLNSGGRSGRNGSGGTDHGRPAPCSWPARGVKQGLVGTMPTA